MADTDAVLTFKDVAELLGIKENTVQLRYRKWGIPYFHLGGGKKPRVRFMESDVRAWIDERREDVGREPARKAARKLLDGLK